MGKLPGKQRGVVLIVSLMLLLVMTIIGVNSLTTTTLQEKMAGNVINSNLAFQSGEVALLEAEAWLSAQNSPGVPVANVGACGTPPCDVFAVNGLGDFPDLGNKPNVWWTTNGKSPANTLVPQVAADPRYVIEETQYVKDSLHAAKFEGRYFYRVTARGTGGNNSAQIFVQSTFTRRF